MLSKMERRFRSGTFSKNKLMVERFNPESATTLTKLYTVQNEHVEVYTGLSTECGHTAGRRATLPENNKQNLKLQLSSSSFIEFFSSFITSV